MEVLLNATETNHNSRLQLTTSKKGVIWFDQVSAMPLETYKVFCLYMSICSLNLVSVSKIYNLFLNM